MAVVIKTNNSTIDDVFETYIGEVRLTQDDFDITANFVDRTTLPKNSGLNWNEPKLSRATASAWNEGEPHPEATLTSSNLQITPALSGLKIIITKRHTEMASENLGAKIAQVMTQALGVYKDDQLITNFDLFTASMPGAGSAFTLGNARAAYATIRKGNGEPYKGKDINGVLHPFTMHDLLESIGGFSSGNPVNTDPGIPGDLLKNYDVRRLVGINFVDDANIDADASDDAKSAIFARQAIRLVDFDMPSTDKEMDKDTGSWIFYGDQDFGHGVYSLAWGVEVYADVTTPTS